MHAGSGAGATIGRYRLSAEIGSGGMASVHLGRLLGPAGFARTVAIKRMSPSLARSAEAAAMFLDEARLAARIRHANVVPTLEVVVHDGELLLIMEYVHGASLADVACGAGGCGPMPPRIAAAVAVGVLEGLHAAHGARGDDGAPLHIVHRDVSPQNVLIGSDGVVRVLDFGIAKAVSSASITAAGQIKGKLGYMAPEQIEGGAADARTDVFAAGVLLWELLAGARLYPGEQRLMAYGARQRAGAPSRLAPGIPAALDAVVLRAVEPERHARFASAHDMATAIEAALVPAGAREVAAWLASTAGEVLQQRAALVAAVERGTATPIIDAAAIADLPTDVGDVGAAAPGAPDAPGAAPDPLPPATASPPTSLPGPPRAVPSPALPGGAPPAAWTRSASAPRRARPLLIAGAAGAVALLAGVALSLGSAAPALGQARAGVARWVEAHPVPPAPTPMPGGGGEGDAAAPAASPSAPPASSGNESTAGGTPAAPPSPRPPAPSTSARAPSCKVTYTIGDDGIKRFKPGCVPGAEPGP